MDSELQTAQETVEFNMGALLVRRSSVERLAELHDVDLGSTEGGADGRSGVGGASRNLELDESGDLLGHFYLQKGLNEIFLSTRRTREASLRSRPTKNN